MADDLDAEFNAWRDSLPATHWAKYDLSACRLGWDAARAAALPVECEHEAHDHPAHDWRQACLKCGVFRGSDLHTSPLNAVPDGVREAGWMGEQPWGWRISVPSDPDHPVQQTREEIVKELRDLLSQGWPPETEAALVIATQAFAASPIVPSPSEGVTVKPLEWERIGEGDLTEESVRMGLTVGWMADSLLGRYVIQVRDGSDSPWWELSVRSHISGVRTLGDSETADDAKDDAQADFRIKSALEPSPSNSRAKAMEDVAAERERQKSVKGWTPEHDDTHTHGELAQAAAAYAFYCTDAENGQPTAVELWPTTWSGDWWKASEDTRRNLVKAGALIVAEIERLDRSLTSETVEK